MHSTAFTVVQIQAAISVREILTRFSPQFPLILGWRRMRDVPSGLVLSTDGPLELPLLKLLGTGEPP